jgi:putative SOS response-associated peptidase YedK
MPAIIEPAQFDLWLDHSVAPDEALCLLGPAKGQWRADPVDPRTPRPERPAKKAPAQPVSKPAQGELF